MSRGPRRTRAFVGCRRSRAGVSVSLGLALVLSLFLPSPASALREVNYELQGKTGDGYRYLFAAYGAGHREGVVGLSIITNTRNAGRGPRSSTWYSPVKSGGRVDRTRIHSRIGARGSVGLRFAATSYRRRGFGPCLTVITRRGILRGHLRFRGEAQAAPGSETALNNLLNIIGRRQGARSVITIG